MPKNSDNPLGSVENEYLKIDSYIFTYFLGIDYSRLIKVVEDNTLF
jgi:hypothetical protein